MKLKIFLSFLLISLVSAAKDEGQSKLEKIKKLEAAAPGGLITFTDKTYSELVL